MNLLDPVKKVMTTKLITVSEEDTLETITNIFEMHAIHHIPVVRFKEIVGMITKTDYLSYLKGVQLLDDVSYREIKAHEVMTTKLAKIEPLDRIQLAIELFTLNRFHALPVVEKDELVGIITPHDILVQLAHQPITLKDYSEGT